METMEIIQQIDRLPLTQKMWVIEKIVHSIRDDEHKIVLQNAADCLYEDYKNDKRLTEFTSLDYQDFYEAR
jgi:hypothetical protein